MIDLEFSEERGQEFVSVMLLRLHVEKFSRLVEHVNDVESVCNYLWSGVPFPEEIDCAIRGVIAGWTMDEVAVHYVEDLVISGKLGNWLRVTDLDSLPSV